MVNFFDLNEEQRKLFFLESFLKRVSLIEKPFVLKGSLLTRQYFPDKHIRKPKDIDFLYAGKVYDDEDAYNTFSDWLVEATEMDIQDGVVFESYRDYVDWEEVSYGMSDDFSTTNTDIECFFKGENGEISGWYSIDIDVSFNFEMTIQPATLEYSSEFFGDFSLPYTVPLPIQIAWKLHQLIVRPRFKDLYDLTFLIEHPGYNEDSIETTLKEIVTECSFDKSITKNDIKKILVDDLTPLYRYCLSLRDDKDLINIAEGKNLELVFNSFAKKLRFSMDKVGINQTAFDNLPTLE